MALEPIIRDTVGLGRGASLGLGELDWLVRCGLTELGRHALPEFIIALAPDDFQRLDPVSFVSFIVGHRAERLIQLTELGAGALDSLEHGSLHLSAIAARALFEIAATSYSVHRILEVDWRRVHGSIESVREIAVSSDSKLWMALWSARLGSRTTDSNSGWPKSIHISDSLRGFGKGNEDFAETVSRIYSQLCEVTHPNSESQAVLWRLASPDRKGRHRVRFEPSASHSPTKLAIVDAVRISYKVIVPYCRDLWWIAAETSCSCDLSRDQDSISLGLPIPTGRNDECCCGSGIKTKYCGHSEPASLSGE